MPEIAEVETVKNTLKLKILNKKITSVNILYSKMIETNLKEFQRVLIGNQFIDIKRIGKYLLFELDNYYLISHLRMEGKYFIKNSTEDIVKHEHIIFNFEDGTDLRYHDTRKFGRMAIVQKDKLNTYSGIAKQGYEPFDSNLTVSYLKNKLRTKTLPIKTLLLDQTIISGLGNIYADEVLFAVKVNPLKKGKELNDEELVSIIKASKDIIKLAIDAGGTTIRSYTSSLGVTGRFQQYLQVHKRENELCNNCKTKINRIKVNGRSTYFCPKCQK